MRSSYHYDCYMIEQKWCGDKDCIMAPNESPNDSESVKELRAQLAALDNDFVTQEQELQTEAMRMHPEVERVQCVSDAFVAKKLLRAWMKATERDHSNNERQKLIQLTQRLLNE